MLKGRPLNTILGCVACAAGTLWLGACGGTSTPGAAVISNAAVRISQANPVAVSPQPGTQDASSSTQISFLGPAGTSVSGVHAVGSRTGVHGGVLRAYSTGTGESFIPAHPFQSGEQVTVSAQVKTPAGVATARTSFTIAHQFTVPQTQFPNNPGNPHAVQHYSTAPTFAPSTVAITTAAKASATPGDLFMAPYQGEGTPGTMIVDQGGNLVWFRPLPKGDTATNFEVQQYHGQPVLTWWQGHVLEVGFGQGEDLIYNSHYQEIGVIRAGNGYHADLHEIRIAPDGTAWIDTFNPIRMNLSADHGLSNGILTDSVVQQVDIKTGLVMWEWHALGHVAITDSHNAPPKSSSPWDYVHVNSVDPGSSGDVLLSARNTWALYDVDIHSGAVRWRMGGTGASFRAGAGATFYWQHDAEFQPGGLISVFDNGSDPPKEKQSRGLLLAPDVAAHRVSLVKQFVNPSRTLLATSQGNTLSLPGGNWLMGYGGLPNFTEYDASGHVLLDGTLGRNVQSFRTYLSPWQGQPPGSPSVVVAPGASSVSVSWNGATEVATWRVLAGASPSSLAVVASAPKHGFQTTISLPSGGPYVQVQALNSAGAAIGASAVVKG
jgi:hypothetical protein